MLCKSYYSYYILAFLYFRFQNSDFWWPYCWKLKKAPRATKNYHGSLKNILSIAVRKTTFCENIIIPIGLELNTDWTGPVELTGEGVCPIYLEEFKHVNLKKVDKVLGNVSATTSWYFLANESQELTNGWMQMVNSSLS